MDATRVPDPGGNRGTGGEAIRRFDRIEQQPTEQPADSFVAATLRAINAGRVELAGQFARAAANETRQRAVRARLDAA